MTLDRRSVGPGPDGSWVEAVSVDAIWMTTVASIPVSQRLNELLAFPPGVELMAELERIDTTGMDADDRLTYLQLWERCSGWVTERSAAASASFITALTDPPEERIFGISGVDIANEASLDQVAIASGMSKTKAGMRIMAGRAFAPDGPLAKTGRAVRAGRISWDVAAAFVDATFMLSDELATAVQDRVLPRAIAAVDPDTGVGCWRSRSWAVRELRRAVIAVDPDTVAKRREEAKRRRYVSLSFDHEVGMAYLTAYLPAHLAMELHDTLNALAGALRAGDVATNPEGRPRGWEAARVDALVEAIRAAGITLAETGAMPSVHGKTRIEVGILIDLPTLLNLADHPGEITGYGAIDPDYARLLAAQADTWRRWVIEPVTGHLLDLGRTRYKPSQELRDYILAAYPECSKPECDRHAARLEIDHAIEWHEGGPTSAANLHALCWQDHLAKTNRRTRVRINTDRSVTHTTDNGLSRTSESPYRTFADNLNHDRTPPQSDDPPF